MTVAYTTDYLIFEEVERPTAKTRFWKVNSKSRDELLGTISWYGAWRQYCFFPTPTTIFNPACLDDISKFVRSKTDEHKARPRD